MMYIPSLEGIIHHCVLTDVPVGSNEVPMMAPPPRSDLEYELRNEIDSTLSGSCSSAISDSTPLFLLSESEANFVNCQSGLPGSDGDLFKKDRELGKPGTYGEITLLGSYLSCWIELLVCACDYRT